MSVTTRAVLSRLLGLSLLSFEDTLMDNEQIQGLRDEVYELSFYQKAKGNCNLLADTAKALDLLLAIKVAAEKMRDENAESDEYHSHACMNWSFLEHSRHQCGTCDLGEALKAIEDA
ncbi:MAG: hypothetical protein GY938_03290 [Ketobacter sp.]|nr:hypothetical protein [Ketobacter sp.]